MIKLRKIQNSFTVVSGESVTPKKSILVTHPKVAESNLLDGHSGIYSVVLTPWLDGSGYAVSLCSILYNKSARLSRKLGNTG